MAAKITYDTTSTPKLIRVNDGITELDVQIDLYSDAKEDWISDSYLAGFEFPFTTVGGEPLTATKSKGPAFFMSSGWRIKPFEGDHELQINGDLFSASVPPTPLNTATSGAFTVSVIFNRTFDSIVTVVTGTGSGTSGGGGSSGGTTTSIGGPANSRGPQLTWHLNTGSIPLLFDLQFGLSRVSGVAPTVSIYRDPDDFVLDWVLGQFVSSASGTNHLGGMTELTNNPGIYRRRFDPATYNQTENNQTYYVIYNGTVPSGFNGATTNIPVSYSEIHRFFVPSGTSSSTVTNLGMTAEFVG